jgi:hypothetical protein
MRGMRIAACLILLASCIFAQSEKDLLVNDQCSVALKDRTVSCMITLDGSDAQRTPHPAGKTWDFWLEIEGRRMMLHPQNGARFGKSSLLPSGQAACQTMTYSRGDFRVDKLTSASYICVRTHDGSIAEIQVNVIDRDGITISLAEWK